MNNQDDSLGDYFSMMRQSITKLDLFIRDIVNYSRNARTELKKEEIKFEEMITQLFEQLQYIPGAGKIERQIEVSGNHPFYSDSNRLSPIFSNLISNAIRYHNFNRDQQFVKVKVEYSEQQAVITIQDNGLGIRQEHLDHIFEMFYRASEDSRGSGLGLYIVKETVAKLKGTISVISSLGQGSTFTLVLPNMGND